MHILSENCFVTIYCFCAVRASLRAWLQAMFANGPAIKGGCVTWRSHPATCSGTLATFESRWQDRYGACFCRPGASLIRCVSGRDTNSNETTFESGYRNVVRSHWCSVAVQAWSKPLLSHDAEVYVQADERIRVWSHKYLSYRQ